MRPEIRAVLPFCVMILLLLLPSCGKRGMPTVKTFEKPQPVQQVKAYHRADEVILTWEYPKDQRRRIKGFRIGRSEEETGVTGEAAFLPEDAAAFTDTDFEPGRRYTYSILTVNLRGIPGDQPVSLAVSPRRPPPPPVGLGFTPRDDALEIRWAPVDVALQKVRYNVYRSAKSGEYGRAPVNPKPLEEPFFIDALDSESRVFYTVRALLDTDIGDEGRPSVELAVNPGTFVPSRPTGVQFVHSDEDVVLTWKGNPETWVSGYAIHRQREGEAGFTEVGAAITPAFRDPGPVRAMTRYYVTAKGPVRQSGASQVVEIEPLKER